MCSQAVFHKHQLGGNDGHLCKIELWLAWSVNCLCYLLALAACVPRLACWSTSLIEERNTCLRCHPAQLTPLPPTVFFPLLFDVTAILALTCSPSILGYTPCSLLHSAKHLHSFLKHPLCTIFLFPQIFIGSPLYGILVPNNFSVPTQPEE